MRGESWQNVNGNRKGQALMTIPAPFARFEGEVRPEWIDFNGHLNLAYYVVLFDGATEVLVHERVSVATQIVAVDDKRLHLAHEMFRCADGRRAATQELMFLHVDLGARRVCPFSPELKARVDAAAAAHAVLPRPDWLGRRVAMPATSEPAGRPRR